MCEDLNVTSKLVLIVSLVIEMSVTSSGLAPTLTVTEGAKKVYKGEPDLALCIPNMPPPGVGAYYMCGPAYVPSRE